MKAFVAVLLIVVLVALLLPAFLPTTTGHRPSMRSYSKANLKQQAVSVYNFHDTHGHLPRGTVYDEDGRALHGWMTAVLPQVEQAALLDQIDLEQPWDALPNAAPFRQPLEVYRNPMVRDETDENGYALAHYAANVHVVSARDPIRFRDVTDGLTNTILGGEVKTNLVAWGSPFNYRNPALGMNTDPRGFGGPWTSHPGTNLMMADGAVRFFDDDIDPAVLAALATPAGGEPIELHQVP